MATSYIRHDKVKTSVVVMHQITTTEVQPTTDVNGSAVDVSGYKSGVFLTRVIANASGTPDVVIDGGMITSNYTTTLWGIFATLLADMTTTANNATAYVNGLPDLIRGRITNTTTTSACRYQVSAKLFAL
jgi:hypothetical protein